MPTPAPDFGDCMDKVLHIYKKCRNSSGSSEYENAFDATEEIEAMVISIETKITQGVPFASKQEAISLIVEIARKVLTEDGSCLGSEIMKGYSFYTIGGAVDNILEKLLPEELAALQADGEMAEKLRYIQNYAASDGLKLELEGAIDQLAMGGYVSDEDEMEDGDGNGAT